MRTEAYGDGRKDEPGARADRPGSFWEEAAPGLGMREEAGGRDEGFGDAGRGVGVHSAVCAHVRARVCACVGGRWGGEARGGRRTPFSTSALRVDGEVCGQADVCAFAGNAFSVSSWKLGMFLFVGRSEISVQCF